MYFSIQWKKYLASVFALGGAVCSVQMNIYVINNLSLK